MSFSSYSTLAHLKSWKLQNSCGTRLVIQICEQGVNFSFIIESSWWSNLALNDRQQLPQASPLLVPSKVLDRLLIWSCYIVAFLTYTQGTTECFLPWFWISSPCSYLSHHSYGAYSITSPLAVEGQNSLVECYFLTLFVQPSIQRFYKVFWKEFL